MWPFRPCCSQMPTRSRKEYQGFCDRPASVAQFTPKWQSAHLKKLAEQGSPTSSPTELTMRHKDTAGPVALPPRGQTSSTDSTSRPSPKGTPSRNSATDPVPTHGGHGKKLSRQQQDVLAKKPEWDAEEKNMPLGPLTKKHYPSLQPNIKSNFYEIRFAPNSTLLRYSITLHAYHGRTPTKRDLKRELIHALMTGASSKLAHNKWAIDYESTIISAEPLFPETEFHNKSTTRTLIRPGRLCRPEDLGCDIKQLENVNCKGLIGHNTDQKNFLTNIEHELKALNIISWKKINDRTQFSGEIHGKKFYPEELLD